MFKLIEYPSSVPLENLDTSYKIQNKIIEHMTFLHSSNDGIILGNIENDNIDLPYIFRGSVCLFAETFFYTEHDIILSDINTNEGMRSISFSYNIKNKSLDVKIENSIQGKFDKTRGDVYFYDNSIMSEGHGCAIKKYMNFSMYFKNGEYFSKRYLKREQS